MTRHSTHRAQRGFTLIELMVALVVSGVVVLGVFAFSNIQRSNASAHERNVMIQQALEGAMASMGQDVQQAGLGFTRSCTELRVWDGAAGRLINPGVGDPNDAVVDPVTQERYWVLRDGVQAHWRSEDAASIDLAVDSFDVILGESAYLGFAGVFNITAPIDTAAGALTASTSALLDPGNADHVAQVQQLFPPGSFVMLAPRPASSTVAFAPQAQGQCVLLQVTDDVTAAVSGTEWSIPVGGTSTFNDLAGLLGDFGNDPACLADAPVPCTDDWTTDTMASISVVPLGRLRWSRYAIDYSITTLPYLVRFDIIGHQPGIDPSDLGAATDYPHCVAGQCPAAGLHLPGSDTPPAAVAIGPMIEDMQVAVGCDGWSDASADELGYRRPDIGFEDLGPLVGAAAGVANAAVDEHTSASTERHRDEWLGNALAETRGPDCVGYGTGEYNRDVWAGLEADPGPPFRMSPRTVRISLVGSAEADEFAGGLATPTLVAVEDRGPLDSLVGSRQRYTLTERFSPENARWQDPRLR